MLKTIVNGVEIGETDCGERPFGHQASHHTFIIFFE